MNKSACGIYVVFGTDYEGSFGHKYFFTEKQALEYKAFKEKTKDFDFEKYHIDTVTVEDENIDYSKIKLFSVLSIEFSNYESVDNSLQEDVDDREIQYYVDNEENEFYKDNRVEITTGNYDKPQLSAKYITVIEDENNINSILQIAEKINHSLMNRASELCKQQMEENKYDDNSCNYIVSKTLEKEFTIKFKEELSNLNKKENENNG